jgi:hypothetical protein
MENGLHGQLGQVAVLFVEVEPKTELEVVTVLHHHLVANIVQETTLMLKLVILLLAFMVGVYFYHFYLFV